MEPSPVGIEDDGSLLGGAARGGARRPLKLGVNFSLGGADLLAAGDGKKSERDESGGAEHGYLQIGKVRIGEGGARRKTYNAKVPTDKPFEENVRALKDPALRVYPFIQ